jgi:hypothetical protein
MWSTTNWLVQLFIIPASLVHSLQKQEKTWLMTCRIIYLHHSDLHTYFHHSMTSHGLLRWPCCCVAAWPHGRMIHKFWTTIKHKKYYSILRKILLIIMKYFSKLWKFYLSKENNTTLIYEIILLRSVKYYLNMNRILLWIMKNTTLACICVATWKHSDIFLCSGNYYYSIACTTTILAIGRK